MTVANPTVPIPARRQPPSVTWSDQEVRLLINQRRNRNIEYHETLGRSRTAFWNSVARRINRSVGSSFNGEQCRRKFDNLVQAYYVSKIL